MRVLHLTSLERGGPLEQSIVLAGKLKARGVDLRVLCANANIAGRLAAVGVDSHVEPLRHALDVRGGERVRRHFSSFDVIHAQDRRSGLWLRLWPRSPEAVRVYTVRGLPDPYLPPPVGNGRPGLRDRLAYEQLEPFLARRTDGVIVASRALAHILETRLHFPASRLTVIPNGVEVPEQPLAKGELVAALGVLEPVKGLDVLLRAAAVLAERGDCPPIALFGEGSLREELETLAKRLGIEAHVVFPGHVRSAEALRRMRVFVLPSYMENCPNALLEAMAAGVPVVASKVGGIPELVDDSCAQLVAPGDAGALAEAISTLLADRDLARLQSAKARRRVETHFTADRNASRVLELYERLMSAGRSGR